MSIFEEMDKAAENAKEELKNLNEEAVIQVAQWWNKWYLKAGHKRLGRILINYLKEKQKS
ncbi:MAG TPA: hypothetical protein ENG63_02360 [Candidatus Desulfofervidus auxilii]|uniref:Uncharacterized protein n=1 Tax=Desulfofervidus auxilii TaxID=1621989 RepID=A0A7C0Y8I5_DESA2|nr:hypothetical protein [Candidatus Desulfofervidus auxilii]